MAVQCLVPCAVQCAKKRNFAGYVIQKQRTEMGKLEDDLRSANSEISSIRALEERFASLKTEQIEVTEENEKMKKELIEWQKVLESEHQQQKRCLRCKSAARRKFRDHSSE